MMSRGRAWYGCACGVKKHQGHGRLGVASSAQILSTALLQRSKQVLQACKARLQCLPRSDSCEASAASRPFLFLFRSRALRRAAMCLAYLEA
jgi:hypothetical protein